MMWLFLVLLWMVWLLLIACRSSTIAVGVAAAAAVVAVLAVTLDDVLTSVVRRHFVGGSRW